MSLRELNIKESYESGFDDIIGDFYCPVLNEAVLYDRIAGFFTSSSFAISAKGIYNLISNGGKMRLLISPRLNKKDIDAIEKAYSSMDEIITSNISKELLLEQDEVIKKHHELLTWLLKEGNLELKIVLIKKDNKYLSSDEIEQRGIFHQKIGIIKDSLNNYITFSGSINETLSAWSENIEEFKVFKSWNDAQSKYCDSDILKFNEYWNGERKNVYVEELPILLKKKLIEIAPSDINETIRYIKKIQKKKTEKKVSLFYYQKDAMEKWLENDKSMLFEMATGTGKTRTAIACIESSLKDNNLKVVVISTPQSTLSLQWKSEVEVLIKDFDRVIVADGNNKWRRKLEETLLQIRIGIVENVIIYTTHATSSSFDFIRLISEAIKCDVKTLFIGDEVHALGSNKRKRALLEGYSERIGLSATPSRWFDEGGTRFLEEYFNNIKYNFSIRDALTTINPLTSKPFLSKYYYYPWFTSLTQLEEEKYIELTNDINRNMYLKDSADDNTYLDKLLRDRADIIKNAEKKYSVLKNILSSIGKDKIENTIIFVSHVQAKPVIEILENMGIRCSLYTQEQGTKPENRFGNKSEREYIIGMFKRKLIKVLVAIRCLDEGIDIPTADKAILVSSTTNPREYIQRVGRVIRQAPDKKEAYIYDLIINPSISSEHDRKIMDREFNRIEHIATNAKNNAEVLKKIYKEFEGGFYGN